MLLLFQSTRASKDTLNELPVIVIIHGGGWSSNDENVMRGLARELTKGGKFVVCSVDYRWIGKLDGDENPNSMKDLIEDVRPNRPSHRISPVRGTQIR